MAAPVSASEQKSVVLHAARMLDVAGGKIVAPGELLVQGDRIREVGTHVARPAGAQVIDLGDVTLMPGLIDAHVHLFLHPGAEDLQTVEESVPQRVLSAAAAAKADVMAGFTAERDMGTEGAGCADVAVRNAIQRGEIPGPRMRVSCNAIDITGGHEDAIGYNPAQHVLSNADYADSAEEVVKVMREQRKGGADFTKIYETGKDRIGLIGPNGAGKSTLLAILAGEAEPDSGELIVRKRARIGYVRQVSDFAAGMTARNILERSMAAAALPTEDREQRLRESLGRAGFDNFDVEAVTLSGGWRKRLAIAEAIAASPDVLLLDEPTNHLDLEGIEWLETTLATAPFACVTVTHDRYFLENVATEVVELNRVYAEGLLRSRGVYSQFLEDRENYVESQQRVAESLRNRVRTEVEWLRRGPKARATKAKARVDNAHALIGKLADVDSRLKSSATDIEFAATDRQTKRLIELENVAVNLGGRTIIRDLSYTVANGQRVGLVGPNGSGKTTILRTITGEITPVSGAIKRASSLRIVYFSQMRELDESLTLRRALAPDADAVVYNDRVVHVASYAAKFLFTGDQLNQPVSRLSGGERARVLIARLMLQPADVLMLDEPTNDLDIPTLEILEDSLLEFPGALVLVTHDRYMLDRVSNTVLGLDGRGNAAIFADYAQWEAWREESATPSEKTTQTSKAPLSREAAASAPAAKKKLSYLEQREFDTIEDRVEAADLRLDDARLRVSDPSVAIDPVALIEALAELDLAQAEHDAIYERWAELTEKAG